MRRKTKSLFISFLLLFAVFFCVYTFNAPTAKANDDLIISKIDVTMTEPMHGEYYDDNFISAEPQRYSVVLTEIKYSDDSSYALAPRTPVFDTSTPYQAGKYYFFFFKVETVGDNVLAEDAEIYVNGTLAQSDLSGGYYASFETLFPITVIEGEAFADDEFTIPMTHVRKGGTFYVKADKEKGDLIFNRWVIEGSPREIGDVQYQLLRIRQGEEVLVVTATYSKLHKITVVGGKAGAQEAVAGRTPKLTLGWVPDGAVFSHWTINGEILELVDNGKRFVMPDEDVYIEAVYHYHVYDGSSKYNENQHWNECADGENCLDLEHSKKNKADHSFDHACDSTCNDGCGYERVTTHTFAKNWSIDANYHWHDCTVEGCSETEGKALHEIENGVCSGCKYIFEVVVKLAPPTLGITVSEYYDYASNLTVNGVFNPDDFGNFGVFTLAQGGLTDSKKQAITDNNTVITEGSYYFYLDLEISTGYKIASNDLFVIAFDSTEKVEYLSYYGGLMIYAQYDLRHTCVDIEPKDHSCDICGANDMGTHEQADGKHTCDYCGETMSSCVDTEPKDHSCDICGANDMGTHEQADGKHTCDYCGETMSSCVDTEPKDHSCDICGATLSSHEDLDKDGICDYCECDIMPSTSEPESSGVESESTITDSSSIDLDEDGFMVGCNGSVANSGLTILTIAGLGAITFLRKRR